MSKVRNVSGGDLDVPFLDRVVHADEVVDVPDFQSDGESPLIWPANRWEPVKAPEPKADGPVTVTKPSRKASGG